MPFGSPSPLSTTYPPRLAPPEAAYYEFHYSHHHYWQRRRGACPSFDHSCAIPASCARPTNPSCQLGRLRRLDDDSGKDAPLTKILDSRQ
eukprot:CAMPEP_0206615424 /NCGR_PEP_ID=MMETSP0325_2-20121206/58182_1 /ASSEMBLY_ACC=CAM_ASM_000347 /TAXON_ID=2866 /ORGANISM="Crypthecodinium cohnii, Strain Seligo" /LENGTH=89 /DNA_ID=CAMNT_0054136515 /DNA_START=119 /DNA_END=385 /DNA_ORIENTATION=-